MPVTVSNAVKMKLDGASVEVRAAFTTLVAQENQREAAHAQAMSRHKSLWSGMDILAGQYTPSTDGMLFNRAVREVADQAAWLARDDYALTKALAAFQTLLCAATQTAETIQSAQSRGIHHPANHRQAHRTLDELRALTARLNRLIDDGEDALAKITPIETENREAA